MSIQKVWTIAATEFSTAVRSKSFILGLLLLPVIMGGSILLQKFAAEQVDTRTRKVAVLDGSGTIMPALQAAVEQRNAAVAPAGKPAIGPIIEFEVITLPQGAVEGTLLELSNRVRDKSLDAFVEIPADVASTTSGVKVSYYSGNPNDDVVRDWLAGVVNGEVRRQRYEEAAIDRQLAERLSAMVQVENLGLLERISAPSSAITPGTDRIKAAEKIDPVRTLVVPAVLMFVIFMVVMTSAPQLLNSVLEEKMSRISEVLLGSVTPFELMLGKLLGNVGIASVLATLYVGAAMPWPSVTGMAMWSILGCSLAWQLFLVLAVMLYGSLYMAIGAACSDLKDAQSLMMPVMLLSMLPIFLWMAVLRNPTSGLSVGLSLFPFSTPFLMLLRMALTPSPPVWQVLLSILLTTLTALACVWAAGKIFRVGLLMHGKTPSYRDMARWVMAR